MTPFERLGLPTDADPRQVRARHAALLRSCRPEDDPVGIAAAAGLLALWSARASRGWFRHDSMTLHLSTLALGFALVIATQWSLMAD